MKTFLLDWLITSFVILCFIFCAVWLVLLLFSFATWNLRPVHDFLYTPRWTGLRVCIIFSTIAGFCWALHIKD